MALLLVVLVTGCGTSSRDQLQAKRTEQIEDARQLFFQAQKTIGRYAYTRDLPLAISLLKQTEGKLKDLEPKPDFYPYIVGLRQDTEGMLEKRKEIEQRIQVYK